jgi:hypothetical protein
MNIRGMATAQVVMLDTFFQHLLGQRPLFFRQLVKQRLSRINRLMAKVRMASIRRKPVDGFILGQTQATFPSIGFRG